MIVLKNFSVIFRKTFSSEPTPLEEGLARTIAWYRDQSKT